MAGAMRIRWLSYSLDASGLIMVVIYDALH